MKYSFYERWTYDGEDLFDVFKQTHDLKTICLSIDFYNVGVEYYHEISDAKVYNLI